MERKILFVEQYEFSPEDKPDKKYMIYVFIDTDTLTVLRGTDLGVKLEKGKYYNAVLSLKGGKIKVDSIQ